MQRINVNLFPKDGYFFRDSNGTVLRAGNWPAVIKKVREYRQRAGFPPGDPATEVIAQACTRNPAYCYEKTHVAVAPQISLKARALQWLNAIMRIPKDQLQFVSPAEAKSRAGICASCPMNQSLGVTSCNSCKQAFTEFRKQLLGGARVRDARLGGCAVLNCDLMTAMHLDEVRVDSAALPQHCWRKKII